MLECVTVCFVFVPMCMCVGRVIVHVKVFHNVCVHVRTCGGICAPSVFERVFASLSVRERPRVCEYVSA